VFVSLSSGTIAQVLASPPPSPGTRELAHAPPVPNHMSLLALATSILAAAISFAAVLAR
jgi:hypothetical protein